MNNLRIEGWIRHGRVELVTRNTRYILVRRNTVYVKFLKVRQLS